MKRSILIVGSFIILCSLNSYTVNHFKSEADSLRALVSKGSYAGVKGTIAHTEAVKESERGLEGAMTPGRDRIYGNIAVQFYF